MEQTSIPLRCVYCGDSIPGVWHDMVLWSWCEECRAWWHYLRQQQRRHRCRARRGQLPKHIGKTVEANTMADRPQCRLLSAPPADGLLAPGTHNPDIPLASAGLARQADHLPSRGHEHLGVVEQLATAPERVAAD